MNPPGADYFERASNRRVASTHEAALKELDVELARAAAKGLIGSSFLLGRFNEVLLARYRSDLPQFGNFLFEAVGDNTPQMVDLLRLHATKLSADLLLLHGEYRQRSGVPGPLPQQMGDKLQNRMVEFGEATVDDFLNGIIGGTRLRKDPLVNIVSTISNSPGAVQQSGIGHLTQSVNQQQFDQLLEAIEALRSSAAVASLPPAQQEAIADVAEAVQAEAIKPKPDRSRIVRWGKRLLGLATEFGIHTAAHTLGAVLASLAGAAK